MRFLKEREERERRQLKNYTSNMPTNAPFLTSRVTATLKEDKEKLNSLRIALTYNYLIRAQRGP